MGLLVSAGGEGGGDTRELNAQKREHCKQAVSVGDFGDKDVGPK